MLTYNTHPSLLFSHTCVAYTRLFNFNSVSVSLYYEYFLQDVSFHFVVIVATATSGRCEQVFPACLGSLHTGWVSHR